MADVSGILAAGKLNNTTTDPLTQMKSFVDLSNAMQYGQNLQQNLRNLQLTEQTGQQSLADKRSTAMAQRLFAIQGLTDDSQVAPEANRILDDALHGGLIDQNHYNIGKQIISTGDPGKIRQYATLGLLGTLAGPDALKAVVPQQTVQDTGGGLTTVTHPSPTQLLPGVGNPNAQPTYTFGTTKSITPETAAGQQSRPATQQDLDDMRAAGVDPDKLGIRIGTTISEPMKDRLIQQGHPELLPGRTGSPPATPPNGGSPSSGQGGGLSPAPAPGTQPAPSNGTTPLQPRGPGNLAPTTSSNGQPANASNPPRLQPVVRPVATAQPPNAATEQQQSADLFGREQTAASDFATRDQQQTAALTALKGADTGPGSESYNHVRSFVMAMAPDVAKAIGMDPQKIVDFDTAKKYLTALAMQTPGAAGSDLRTNLSQLSNPSTEISNAAARHIMATIQGLSRMRQAAFQDFVTKNTVPGTGGDTGIPAQTTPGSSANFGRHLTDFSKNYDYRAFTPLDPDEMAKVVHSLKTQADKNKFGRSLELARENGWIQ